MCRLFPGQSRCARVKGGDRARARVQGRAAVKAQAAAHRGFPRQRVCVQVTTQCVEGGEGAQVRVCGAVRGEKRRRRVADRSRGQSGWTRVMTRRRRERPEAAGARVRGGTVVESTHAVVGRAGGS